MVAAGYMVIMNKASSPDRLVSVSSPAAARVETHVHIKDGNVVRMRQVKGYDIPANGRFELKPGGAHLMFIEPRLPFKEGDKIPAVLVFERAGEVKTQFQVVRLGATGAGHAH
jgi:copper(I)-binding protein